MRNIKKIKKNYKKRIVMYKMGKVAKRFGNIEVEKHKLHQHESSIILYDVNVNIIEVPNTVPFGKNDFK